MILGEPPRTQADLNFRLFGIPVRIHPFFWVVALLLGMGAGPVDPVHMLLWVVAVFFSILVHEMGHAFAARAYGWEPHVTLHGFGGLASYRPTHHSTRAQVLISAAGPVAGFALAALVVLLIAATGHHVAFEPSIMPVRFEYFAAANVNLLIVYLLYVNIFWGLMNLLPVYPLDGGQIARELLVEQNPRDGLKLSLWISIAFAAGVALFAVSLRQFYLAILFGFLGYSCYTTLQFRGGGGTWR